MESEPVVMIVSDDEVIVYVRGLAVLRAAYEAEGYYDEAADGDPEEQDLWHIEVLDRTRSVEAAEALGGRPLGPLAALGLTESRLHRLFPASHWTSSQSGPASVARYLLVLAHALAGASGPTERQRVLTASVLWLPEVIDDMAGSLLASWNDASWEESTRWKPHPSDSVS